MVIASLSGEIHQEQSLHPKQGQILGWSQDERRKDKVDVIQSAMGIYQSYQTK